MNTKQRILIEVAWRNSQQQGNWQWLVIIDGERRQCNKKDRPD
ncbi:hypothetical protein [Lactiplantibacillus plajomi]|uniref:Uncharacterized protein n=1 Tax=Lactiplantibacillus plajomi TaxID=1457217 RepID=A0ABV6K326_9LACO|nr:hypothetical protein [Lactiplantibacillus plajomi]